jgi:hypothetical protein
MKADDYRIWKNALTVLGGYLHSIVFVVGCFTIYDHSSARWPTATSVMIALSIAGGLAVYLWIFFVRPFREAASDGVARVEANQTPDRTRLAHPEIPGGPPRA